MRRVIFIRSFRNDLRWLQFALRSIKKYVTGCDAVVVTVPQADVRLFRDAGIECVPCPDFKRGYLAQQATKMTADFFIKGGDAWVVFMDSDCVFTAPFDLAALFVPDGAPIALYTPYAVLGAAVPWQKPTEAALGFPCPNETMRRHGIVYSTQELRKFRAWFASARRQNIAAYIENVSETPANFSEFNVLGSWLWQFYRDSRRWYDSSRETPPALPLRQGFSWDGIEKDLAELERIVA